MDILLSVLSFFKMHILSALDIIVLAVIVYKLYKYINGTIALPLIKGLFVLFFFCILAYFLKLQTLLWILNAIMPALTIVVFIIILPQIKQILIDLGSLNILNFELNRKENIELDEILDSCKYLSSKKRGALIVFERENSLESILESGVQINASIKKELLNAIFEYNTQLHDGAVIISKTGKILAASCLLPLSNRNDMKQTFGTRHRAAIGVSENNDCVVLVLSEENGALSIAYNSRIYYGLQESEIKAQLFEFLGFEKEEKNV